MISVPGASQSLPHRARSAAAVLAASLAAAGLAGCSNNPYPPGQTAEKIIYRYLPGDLRTLDPVKSYTVDEAYVVDVLYAQFFQYHPLKQAPYVLQLGLGAEEPLREPYLYTETKDGKSRQVRGERWRFRIKRGLKFQDDPCFPGGKGREIVAADILYAFRRMADPANGCPVTSFFEDKIIGFDRYVASGRTARKLDYAAPVEGLQLDPKDPYTLRILLNQPYPQLRYLMAMHFTAPMAHEAVAKYGKDLARHPVGCGPYVLAEYSEKRRIVLEKNPNRNREVYPSDGDPGDAEAGLLRDAGKEVPFADRVVFSFIRERITAWNFFLQGYLDRFSVNQENFSQVVTSQGLLSPEMKKRGAVLFKAAQPNIIYFGFNMKDPVVGGYTPEKRKLRQAISQAIDSQEFIDLLYEGNGKVPEFLIPPGIFGYDPEFRNPYKRFDLDRAKQYLAEAGYPGGKDARTGERLTIYYDNTATTPEQRQFTSLLQKQVERLGIKLESRVFRDIIWQDRVDKGQYQFIRYGWYADYPDPENFVFLLYGPNRGPGPNHTFYENPEYDRLFEQMRAMDDGPERRALIRRMRDIAVEDGPWVYLMNLETLGLTYDWVTNVKPHGVANDSMKWWAVEGDKRARRQAEWNQPNYWPTLGALVLLFAGSVPAAAVVRQRRRRRVRVERGEEA